MMRRKFYFSSSAGIGLALIYIVFGLIVTLFGKDLILTAARFMGILIMVYGGWQAYSYFQSTIQRSSSLVIGILALAVGAFMVVNPGTIVSFFPTIVGVILTFNGLLGLIRAFSSKGFGNNWIFSGILSFALMIFGLSLFLSPLSTLNSIIKICGIVLIAQGLLILFGSLTSKNPYR